MPSTIVQIEWDQPDDVNWLNRFNIELALSAYCKNTHFMVTDVVVPRVREQTPEETHERFPFT